MSKFVFLSLLLVQGVMLMPFSTINPEYALQMYMQQNQAQQQQGPAVQLPVEHVVNIPVQESLQRESRMHTVRVHYHMQEISRRETIIAVAFVGGALLVSFCFFAVAVPITYAFFVPR